MDQQHYRQDMLCLDEESCPANPSHPSLWNADRESLNQSSVLANTHENCSSSGSGYDVGDTASQETQSSRVAREESSWSLDFNTFDASGGNDSGSCSCSWSEHSDAQAEPSHSSSNSFLRSNKQRPDNTKPQIGRTVLPSVSPNNCEKGEVQTQLCQATNLPQRSGKSHQERYNPHEQLTYPRRRNGCNRSHSEVGKTILQRPFPSYKDKAASFVQEGRAQPSVTSTMHAGQAQDSGPQIGHLPPMNIMSWSVYQAPLAQGPSHPSVQTYTNDLDQYLTNVIISDAPWSSENPRNDQMDPRGTSYTPNTEPASLGGDETTSVDASALMCWLPTPSPAPGLPTGQSNDNMGESYSTIRPTAITLHQDHRSRAREIPVPQNHLPYRGKAEVFDYFSNDTLSYHPERSNNTGHSSVFQHDVGTGYGGTSTSGTYLGVPPRGPSSPTLSSGSPTSPGIPSPTPSELPDILECPFLGCGVRFRGEYRRGNRQRHLRQLHGRNGSAVIIMCEVEGCRRTFKRTDARLKHYRRHHPHLGQGPALPRKQNQPASFEKQNQSSVFERQNQSSIFERQNQSSVFERQNQSSVFERQNQSSVFEKQNQDLRNVSGWTGDDYEREAPLSMPYGI